MGIRCIFKFNDSFIIYFQSAVKQWLEIHGWNFEENKGEGLFLCFPRNFSCFSLCTHLSNHIRRHLLLASFCNVDYFQAENLMNFREMTFIVESLTRLSTSRPSFEDITGSFMYFCVCICICRCTCIAKLQKIVYCINGNTFHDFYFVH